MSLPDPNWGLGRLPRARHGTTRKSADPLTDFGACVRLALRLSVAKHKRSATRRAQRWRRDGQGSITIVANPIGGYSVRKFLTPPAVARQGCSLSIPDGAHRGQKSVTESFTPDKRHFKAPSRHFRATIRGVRKYHPCRARG